MRNMGLGLGACVVGLTLSQAAGATDLPTYINGYAWAGAVQDGDGANYAATGATASGAWSANDGLAAASASISGRPTLRLTADGSALAGGSASAASGISYFVTVNGPVGFTDLVPIRFAANLATSEGVGGAPQGYDGSPRTYAGAAFSLGGNFETAGGAYFWELRDCNTACASGRFANGQYLDGAGSPTLAFALSGLTGLRVGSMGVVSETVQIQAGVAGFFTDGFANASASADPYFFIDETFLAEHPDVTLTISSQVGNSPLTGGVPEPASWALMLLGFGAAGAILRGRRSTAAV
jgi:hypothetical protein